MRKVVKDEAYWRREKEKRQQYYQENKERIKQRRKQYYYENLQVLSDKAKAVRNTPEFKAKRKEYDRKYRQLHKEKRRIQNRESEMRRMKNEPAFKIRKHLRNAIYCALLRNKSSKNNLSILHYLPYTIEDLKVHLEAQFESWMNWENWGIYDPNTWVDNDPNTWTWQLDHVIPQCMFSYTSMTDDEFLKCWALCNLRPYSAKQNCLENTPEKRLGKK